MSKVPKIVVIGAGIGGLTTATLLAQAGLEVVVLETNTYPGGCAGTFYHKGYRFDAGATLVAGFHAGGPHSILGEQLKIIWPAHQTEPAWVVHLPERRVALNREHADIIAQFPHSEPFWNQQKSIADITWSLAARGIPWPPAGLFELRQLLRTSLSHFPDIALLLPFIFSTTAKWLYHHGLTSDKEFVRLIDTQLLISAQATARHANALYSATALDLPRKGSYHIKGGIGAIAQTLSDKLVALGGQIFYRSRVTGVAAREGRARGVYFQTGKRASKQNFLPADFLIANLTPASLDRLLGENSPPRLNREAARQQSGWGAFALHLGVETAKLPPNIANHHQIVADMESPLGEGRSIFLSISPEWDTDRAPTGRRAVTITTHTDVREWWRLLQTNPDAYAARKEEYTQRILNTVDSYLPGFRRSISLTLAGTPITYAHYTGRHLGLVGGFPQTSLLKARGSQTGMPNLRIVGDSIFPGQSTAGVTLGAMRAARDVLRALTQTASRDFRLLSQIEGQL